MVLAAWPVVAVAQADPMLSSSSYSVVESSLGASGDVNGTSTNYRFLPGSDDGGITLGELTTGGASSSAGYTTQSGFNTASAPALGVTVSTATVSLGSLSTTLKSTATASFSVSNYTSYGYAVKLIGSPPSNNGHALTAMTTTSYGDASSAGTEQFGVNLVLNNISGVGADPVQVPSSVFSFGQAGDWTSGGTTSGVDRPYTVPERWRFVSGETIASGPKSSGQTNFTMTLLGNISTASPGGVYSGGLTIIVTGTY